MRGVILGTTGAGGLVALPSARHVRMEKAMNLPENVVAVTTTQRTWNGVEIDVAEFRCSGPVLHKLRHADKSRLSVILEEVGGQCEPRIRRDQPCLDTYGPRHMHFAPGGMEMWGYSASARFVRDANLTFDPRTIGDRLDLKTSSGAFTTPRSRFCDDRIWTLVRLLADAVNLDDPSTQLYGDGLSTAIAALLFHGDREAEVTKKGLAPWQLQRTLDHLEMRLPDRIELRELAALTGLSQSHFMRSFKASTGMAPYRWQLEARIGRAKQLLMDTGASLDHVADATGFADATHFGRTFRKITGATPAAWRRDRKS